ncbi:hypothetical protein DFH28DRAFT_931120 [Melampsora americana]|nr:hypothetical protein DFH28DRAFT_931120 [Melampsora americana]
MSYLLSHSLLMFGINLWQVVKSTMTRTQAKLEQSLKSAIVPCSAQIAMKSNPVIETSFVCASRYEVRSLSCQPLAAPSAILEICHPVVAIAEVESKEVLQLEPLSNGKEESSSIDNLLAVDSLYNSNSSYETHQPNLEPIEVHLRPGSPSSCKTNCAPSSFLAFLEASHLEMSERLQSQQPKPTTLDLGCAQFNSAYYRRHPPPSLPQLKVNRPSEQPFCWKSKLDEIMREYGEECDVTVELEASSTGFDQDFPSSSSSNPCHSRSSSIASDKTCVESSEIVDILTIKELEQKPLSITLTHPDSLSQAIIDSKPILPSTSSISSCTPSSFLAFIESSNLEMLKRMQEEKSKTLDIECAKFNPADHRRNLPSRHPRLKSTKQFCWKSILDEMLREEECENVATEMFKNITTKPKRMISSYTSYTASPHVRSTSCSSNATCVEEIPSTMTFSKDNTVLLTSSVEPFP